jgi:putative tryptophan/tyrosine transport system substrate-binding protein
MRRRAFITLLGAATTWPLAGRAQQAERARRIGALTNAEASDPEWMRQIAAFREQLEASGWVEGRNVSLDYRFAAGDAGRMSAAAKDLVGLKPDVILARSTPVVKALMPETRTIPIVFVSVSDPVGENFAASMARPGGNITGLTNVEASMGGKWLELLKEVAPGIRRATVLFNPKVAPAGGLFYLRTIEAAAGSLAVALNPVPVFTLAEIEAAVATLARESDSGLIVMPDPFIVPNRELVMALAARHRLPAVYGFRNMAVEGGLMSYGVDLVDLYRRSADYVDRILKGVQPSELPIQAPTRFELIVNLKTAKAMGLNIPESFLVRADEVIE